MTNKIIGTTAAIMILAAVVSVGMRICPI